MELVAQEPPTKDMLEEPHQQEIMVPGAAVLERLVKAPGVVMEGLVLHLQLQDLLCIVQVVVAVEGII
jgi:hypothetical protein